MTSGGVDTIATTTTTTTTTTMTSPHTTDSVVVDVQAAVLPSTKEWDLTLAVAPFLDRHMMFPLLEYLDTRIDAGTCSYKKQDVAAARLALLRPTHMVDYAVDMYRSLHEQSGINNNNNDTIEIPMEMQKQREQVLKDLDALKQECEPLEVLFRDTELRNHLMLQGQWNVEGIATHLPEDRVPVASASAAEELVDSYLRWARFKFDCGDYQAARDMLDNYMSLFSKRPVVTTTTTTTTPAGAATLTGANPDEEDEELLATTMQVQQQQQQDPKDLGNPTLYYLTSIDTDMLQVLWGRLAAEILLEDWQAASVGVEAVKAALETLAAQHQLSHVQALQQRCWLMHWCLFVFWNDSAAKGGLERLVDLFQQQDRYKQAITVVAPHLLRYLTAAVLLCKRRVVTKKGAAATAGNTAIEARRLLKQLVHVMQDCEYSDPIVEFVNCLAVKYDFDMAQEKLAECEHVLAADFFLCHQTDLFMEEARVFVFENYCRIHHKIDLHAAGAKLAMDSDQAERWIVDLIRNAGLDAKIDNDESAGESCVVMGSSNTLSIYEQVMDRTRDLNVRSATLAQNLHHVLTEAKKERVKKKRSVMDD